MIEKADLRDAKVAFKIQGIEGTVFFGTVMAVESDGFWIDSEDLIANAQPQIPKHALAAEFRKPIVFVPTTALQYLITTDPRA